MPTALEFGELSLNYTDGKLYYKNNENEIKEIKSNDTQQPLIPNGGVTLYMFDDGPAKALISTEIPSEIYNGDNLNLIYVKFGDNLTTINDGAFVYTSLSGPIMLHNNFTFIGSNVFLGCENITDIYLNIAYEVISNENAFQTMFEEPLNVAGPYKLYVTPEYINGFGGINAVYGQRKVAKWTSYPNIMT